MKSEYFIFLVLILFGTCALASLEHEKLRLCGVSL